MIKINLLPARAARKKENLRQQISIAAFSICFALMVMIGSQVFIVNGIGKTEDEIVSMNRDMESLKRIAKEIKTLKEKREIFEKKFNIIKSLRENKTGPVHLLDDL